MCEITQCSQLNPPTPIQGSILADEMGLGKTIQTLGLILLSPPTGRRYSNGADQDNNPFIKSKAAAGRIEELQQEVLVVDDRSVPSVHDIRYQSISSLKSLLGTAGLKISGKKDDLVERVVEGIKNGLISGAPFQQKTPTSVNLELKLAPSNISKNGTCTLIVCPVSVMSNWQQQLRNHVRKNVLSLELFHGPNRTHVLHDVERGRVDILLISYHTLSTELNNTCSITAGENESGSHMKKSKILSIFDIPFHRIVLDEAVS